MIGHYSLFLRHKTADINIRVYFEAFMNAIEEKEQEKNQYGLLLLKT